MILLTCENAYSQFRMDAIRAALEGAVPGLGSVGIEARWVYALDMADAAVSVEELQRAASLLNADFEGLGVVGELDELGRREGEHDFEIRSARPPRTGGNPSPCSNA